MKYLASFASEVSTAFSEAYSSEAAASAAKAGHPFSQQAARYSAKENNIVDFHV